MNFTLVGKDVLIWFCRETDQWFQDIEAYRRGEQNQLGRIYEERTEKVLHAIDEYACQHVLLVCEEDCRYAAFVKGEYEKGHPSRVARASFDLIAEKKLVSLLQAADKNVIYIVPDSKELPAALNDLPKYLFGDKKMCPWPAKRPVKLNVEPAKWTQFFLPGSHELAYQLENVRTVLKHKNESGVPQYVLITGATGTGKSFFTRNLPRICDSKYDNPEEAFKEPTREERTAKNYGYRQGNCASLSPELADTLLFGAVKGAYTGRDRDVDGLIEGAGDGILFLDEVGDLPLETQGKLLTALEEKVYYRLGDTGKAPETRYVRCSIIFGTNRDLAADAQRWEESHGKNGFRKDLLYRINSCHVELPALQKRLSGKGQQGQALLDDIVKCYCEGIGLALTARAREAFNAFACQYAWPGNFRDVKHLFEGLKLKALEEDTGPVVSAYAMNQAVERLANAKAAGGNGTAGAEECAVPLIDTTKASFKSPRDAIDIDFIFNICKSAQSCADAGRAYYGTDKNRNFADAFGKRLAHFKLVFDKSAPNHLSSLEADQAE